jgi:hypothetical protein
MAYIEQMRTRPITVAETAVFMRQAGALWTDDERFEFVDFIARNPEAGDLIPASGGIRKVSGAGKAAASEAESASSTFTMIQQCRFTC